MRKGNLKKLMKESGITMSGDGFASVPRAGTVPVS
jgi:hypothetical protein